MVCRERNTERLYPLTDPNGNVVAIADVSGDVKERYRYDAFGKVTLLNPDFTTKVASDFDWDYLYTSHQLDKESGLQYSRYRYYHPGLGRFVNRDPIEYEAEDANLYRYVGNSPLSCTDPLGLWGIWQPQWWYDSDRSWGDWGYGWRDWGYNTGGPVLGPPNIVGAVEAAPGIGEGVIVNDPRNRFIDGVINNDPNTDDQWREYYDRCEQHNQRNP